MTTTERKTGETTQARRVHRDPSASPTSAWQPPEPS